ncbi:hypothetical protein E8E13_000221 [Curvularia kusanoi]|uniref:Uncharacterized protein n=1 Tax=Curvularia kusanoi TaxID=90978 RepID=A0A9P4T421_CURKU|nr:hypothetical protein E8E13_000221 [Curvularia kusanoi]
MSDWLEPARDKDDLLVLPSNKRRRATNIWHEEMREEVHRGASSEPSSSATASDSQPSQPEPQRRPRRDTDAANDKAVFVKPQASAPSPDDGGVVLTGRETSAPSSQGSESTSTEHQASPSSSHDSEMALTQADVSPSDKSEAMTTRLDSVMYISENEEAKADKGKHQQLKFSSYLSDPQPVKKAIKATKKAAGKVRTFVPDSEEDSDYEELSDREDREDDESADETGSLYTQETTTPKPLNTPPTLSIPGSTIFPSVSTAKIPRTLSNTPWTPLPGSQNHTWTRGGGDDGNSNSEIWRVTMFFRRLSRTAHTHTETYHSARAVLETDPNSTRFRSWYNKWILQFARRHDNAYTQRVTRVHWSAAERRVLYAQINAFCARHGLHRFSVRDGGLLKAQRDDMAAAVNKVQNPRRSEPRNADAVRSQIASARGGDSPKNKPVFEALRRAEDVRRRIAAGERVERAEQYPEYAIPLELFPGDAGDGEGQREAGGSERDDDSSGLSSPPESEDEV